MLFGKKSEKTESTSFSESNDFTYETDCKQLLNIEFIPDFECSEIPATPRIQAQIPGENKREKRFSVFDDASGRCLNPNTIRHLGEARTCDDGVQRIGTKEWQNKLGENIAMVLQCTSDDFSANTILYNETTRKACFFLKKDSNPRTGQPSGLVQESLTCVGCHQPYLFISTPLSRTDHLALALAIENDDKIASYQKFQERKNDSKEGVRFSVGYPARFKYSTYRLSDLVESSSESFQASALSYEKYPNLLANCGKCHKLGANPDSLARASIFTGLCKFREASGEEPKACWNYQMAAFDLYDGKPIHEILFGVSPFPNLLNGEQGDAQSAVFKELTAALQDCNTYHKEAKGCQKERAISEEN
jgi:hypothetical protein